MSDRMLIVDDGKMNREILKNLFRDKYDISEAEKGEQALNMIAEQNGNIDIVLLDLIMPGMSGLEVLRECRCVDSLQNIPIVVITSSENMEDQIEAFNLGASDFIAKPFVPAVVVSRVDNVLSSSRRVLSMKREAQQLKLKSELDEMTGIYNKVTTESEMDRLLRVSNEHLEVMMIIDIDNFKTVNDTLGHREGDHVIKMIANLIASQFRKSDIVGRVGGDEFCVMMVDVPNMDIALAKVNEMLQIMKYKPNIPIPEYVTLSIGIASNDRKRTTYEELFKKADEALYNAKHGGKAQFRQYGHNPVQKLIDERDIAVLFSNNRSVRSIISASLPNHIRVVEASAMENLIEMNPSMIESIKIFYMDVSEYEGDAAEFWKEIKKIDWIDRQKIIAVCEEGNVAQYLAALNSGIADMVTEPIEHDAFKKRTIRYLEKLGLKGL